jgi:non-ribosomal peptide synthetase component F
LVLRAYIGTDQVSFGYLSSGRDAPVRQIEIMVGAVCNMLVFTMNLDKSKTITQLLQNAQNDWADTLQDQFMSLSDIQHRHGAQALFNTAMSYRSNGRILQNVESTDMLSFESVSGHDTS